MFHSEFTNGFWSWEDDRKCLFFNKTTDPEKAPKNVQEKRISDLELDFKPCNTVKFKEVISRVAQAQFRRYYRRKVEVGHPDVVTIQDIKDVVLYTAEVEDLSVEFINFFHLPTIDAFLRAAIIYFQYFFQVWEHVEERRIEARKKITQPIVTELEDVISENLGDLRSMFSREYHRVTCGMGEAWKFYHLNTKNSTSDKDRRLFEALIAVSVRVIWCALHRKNISLIETELNRLMRTRIFNLIEHRTKRVDTFDMSAAEKRYVWGKACRDEKKLKHRSPLAQELMFAEHDYKMLAIGIRQIDSNDPRQKFLEIAYTAPCELLFELGVGIGILGYPKKELNVILKPRDRTKTDVLGAEFVPPTFNLPPKSSKKEVVKELEEIANSLPQKEPFYTESNETKKARNHQRLLWIKHVELKGTLFKKNGMPAGASFMESNPIQFSMRSTISGGLAV